MGLGVCRAILSQRSTHLKQGNQHEINSLKLFSPPDYIHEVISHILLINLNFMINI